MIAELKKFLRIRTTTLDDLVMNKARALDQRILEEELNRIDHNHMIEAYQEKKAFLLAWLDRDTPKNVHAIGGR